MFSSYSLRCTVCRDDYFCKKDWLRHLTGGEHQKLAESKFLEEWSRSESRIKECCLVIFSSFPLTLTSAGGAEQVIQYFSQEPGTLVTDFIRWIGRDCIGIVQFESRDKAKDAYFGLKDCKEVFVDSGKIQIRWGEDIGEVEWSALFPGSGNMSIENCRRRAETRVDEMVEEVSSCINFTDSDVVERSEPDEDEVARIVSDYTTKYKLRHGSKSLEEIAGRLNWKMPEYEVYINSNLKSKYQCSIVLNGVKYKEPRRSKKTRSAAIKYAAKLCIIELATNSTNRKGGRKNRILNGNMIFPFGCYPHRLKLDKRKWVEDEDEEEIKFEHPPKSLKPGPSSGAIRDQIQDSLIFSDESSDEVKIFKDECCDSLDDAESISSSLSTFSNDSSTANSLEYQFECIQKVVTIPEDEFAMAQQVISTLRAVFIRKIPTIEVVLFRNWYLKLRNPNCRASNELLIYAYSSESHPDFPSSFSYLSPFTMTEILRTPECRNWFTEVPQNPHDCSQQQGWKLTCKLNGVTFRLLTHVRFFVEVQVCRLIEYMCTFDPRCRYVLVLAYYWISVNSVNFGRVISANSHVSLPTPHTLQWLVMVFLCRKEIIPTPRVIQKLLHRKVKDQLTGIDVGFFADPEFTQGWISERNTNQKSPDDDTPFRNVVKVMELFKEFLQFCGNTLNNNGNWILNTKDGEVISTESFLTSGPNTTWKTTMSGKEVLDLRTVQHHVKGLASFSVCHDINFRNFKLYMVHPLISTWRFSMSNNVSRVLNLMESSGTDLSNFLKLVERHHGGGTASEVPMNRFGDLRDVLKVRQC